MAGKCVTRGKRRTGELVLAALVFFGVGGNLGAKEMVSKDKPAFQLIVMDPLAKELACSCVRGYAQRDYHQLALHLGKALRQRVIVSFSDNLVESMAKTAPEEEVLVIGKQSVIEHDAEAAKLKYRLLCRLTGQDGSTTLTGCFVVRGLDPARELKDIGGRRMLFGPSNSDENHREALEALRAAKVPLPVQIETREASSDAAIDVVDSKEDPGPVGLMSSYALPLVVGCGTIKKGDLRVIGETKPVPFIAVFCSANVGPEKQKKITDMLLAIAKNKKLLKALETRNGFVSFEGSSASTGTGTNSKEEAWPDWRGPGRDGRVPHLPARLPEKARLVWQRPAMNGGLAGIAVAGGRVIIADRDPADERDVFRCLRADNGELLWMLDYPAPGKLDYGQFPRATPVVYGEKVFLLGAFGNLHCVNLADGKVLWELHLVKDLRGQRPTWGYCATPLVVENLLIVNPGGPGASLVGLDWRTGKTRWSSAGQPAAYASFIAGKFGGKFQIVGYDKASLGGWDPKSGRRLWTLTPPIEGDFNVTTPLPVNANLLLATENNGTRVYGFNPDGTIIPAPLAHYAELSPDTTTPVATNGRIFGCSQGMHCLDQNLRRVWYTDKDLFGDHATLFADNERVLVVALNGELFLVGASSNTFELISRLRLFEDDEEVYSHPALVNDRVYIRGGTSVCCFDLARKEPAGSRPQAETKLF